ncbi:MAG: hypothetical protein ACM3JJ_06140 [Hyphomicrobiales bacterium]
MVRRWLSALCSLAVVAPLAVDVRAPDPDSSATSLKVAFGAGSYAYVTRGCEGQVIDRYQRRFRDAGVEVKHRFDGPVEVGSRVHLLRRFPEYEKNTLVWNPNVSVEGGKIGFGLGVNLNRGKTPYVDRDFEISPVTGHLRLGSLRSVYFSMHVFEDVPIASGGGPVRMGLGFDVPRVMDGWVGMGTPPPYDKPGFVAKADVHVTRFLDLNFAGRLGGSEGLTENSGSVGITIVDRRVKRK